MRASTLTVLFFGVFVLGLAPQSAVAKTDSVEAALNENLRALIREARRSYDAGEYLQALAALRSANELNPQPRLHYNMARCYEHLGKQREEYDELNLYLKPDPEIGKDAKLLTQVQGRVDVLRKALGFDPSVAAGPKVPVYKRWWLWSTVSSVAAVVAVIAGTALSEQLNRPTPEGTEVLIPHWTTSMTQTARFQLRW